MGERKRSKPTAGERLAAEQEWLDTLEFGEWPEVLRCRARLGRIGRALAGVEAKRRGRLKAKEAGEMAPEVQHEAHNGLLRGMVEAERKVVWKLNREHPGAVILHSGWPDFLVQSGDGKVFAVEVKRDDGLRPQQVALFAMLERAGIEVFVWRAHEDKPVLWREAAVKVTKKRGPKPRARDTVARNGNGRP